MFDLPVSSPHTPYDFLALIETYRHDLKQLDFSDLSILYGLSCLEFFRDQAFCQQVDRYLDSHPDPLRARYEFAYHLASSFWEFFAMWQMRQVEGPDGKRWEIIKPGQTGYVGEFPDALRAQIMDWLLAGIAAFRDDDELMQLIRWLKYRKDMSDTSLSRAELAVLEQALGEEIDFHKDKRAQALIQNLIETWNARDGQEPNGPDEDGP